MVITVKVIGTLLLFFFLNLLLIKLTKEHRKMTNFKCNLCGKRYKTRQELETHLENEHKDELNGLSPRQYLFNYRNKKDHGTCVMCKRKTEWNEETGRYERFCSEKCRKDYREMFKKRMNKKYGTTHLLNDPDIQKKMLANRKISGTYTWNNGYKHTYTGSYEKDFLEFMEDAIKWKNPSDIMMPALRL